MPSAYLYIALKASKESASGMRTDTGKVAESLTFIELGGTPRWINLYAVADADVYYNYEA